jgi:chloramphenicol O-acetyltransferase type A
MHYEYYRKTIPCGYSVTVKMDVTNLLQFSKKENKKFYGCFLYAAAKTVNSLDFLRMMTPSEGEVGVWKVSHPNFTVFHEDDETFSDLWTEYHSDFAVFYTEWERVVKEYGSNKGIKGRMNQPANFFCISCVPWLDYTGYSTYSVGEPALFPIITFGKYTKQNGSVRLPVTMTISHASADGFHTSIFFKKLQEYLNEF